eukprot:jgi/Psemu1/303334/fgenesh1_kg.100_\
MWFTRTGPAELSIPRRKTRKKKETLFSDKVCLLPDLSDAKNFSVVVEWWWLGWSRTNAQPGRSDGWLVLEVIRGNGGHGSFAYRNTIAIDDPRKYPAV